jgi:hypothetical protein
MSEEKKSRKGQVHRTWVRVLIDEVKAKAEKYTEMKDDVVQSFLDFMETVDEKIKSKRKDKGFDLMVGRYKNLSKDDFLKMIGRQVEAFKESRNQTTAAKEEESIMDLLKDL